MATNCLHVISMRLAYNALTTKSLPITLLAGGQDRVIESAQWFQDGTSCIPSTQLNQWIDH